MENSSKAFKDMAYGPGNYDDINEILQSSIDEFHVARDKYLREIEAELIMAIAEYKITALKETLLYYFKARAARDTKRAYKVINCLIKAAELHQLEISANNQLSNKDKETDLNKVTNIFSKEISTLNTQLNQDFEDYVQNFLFKIYANPLQSSDDIFREYVESHLVDEIIAPLKEKRKSTINSLEARLKSLAASFTIPSGADENLAITEKKEQLVCDSLYEKFMQQYKRITLAITEVELICEERRGLEVKIINLEYNYIAGQEYIITSALISRMEIHINVLTSTVVSRMGTHINVIEYGDSSLGNATSSSAASDENDSESITSAAIGTAENPMEVDMGDQSLYEALHYAGFILVGPLLFNLIDAPDVTQM